jgi:hypothetical protein
MREGIPEDRHRSVLGRPCNIPDEPSDHAVKQGKLLTLAIETPEQLADTCGALERLVFGPDGVAPSFAEASMQQGRPGAGERERQKNGVENA